MVVYPCGCKCYSECVGCRLQCFSEGSKSQNQNCPSAGHPLEAPRTGFQCLNFFSSSISYGPSCLKNLLCAFLCNINMYIQPNRNTYSLFWSVVLFVASCSKLWLCKTTWVSTSVIRISNNLGHMKYFFRQILSIEFPALGQFWFFDFDPSEKHCTPSNKVGLFFIHT